MAIKDGERVRVKDYYADKHRMIEVYDIIDGEGVRVRNVITGHAFGMTFKELEEGWDLVTPALQHGRSDVVDRLISEL